MCALLPRSLDAYALAQRESGMAYIDKLLTADEDVLVYGRQHGIVVCFDVLKRVIALLLLAIIMFGVQSDALTSFLRSQSWLEPLLVGDLWVNFVSYVQIGCLLLMGLVLVLIVLDYLRWTVTSYIITERRLLSISGLINKRSYDSSLHRINDIQLEQSWLGQMLNFGDLVILTSGDQSGHALRYVLDPLDFKRALQEAKFEANDRMRERQRPAEPAPIFSRDDQGVSEALHTLLQLRAQNLITPEEFNAKKRELLSRL